jgi:hypothetical protein
MYKILIFGQLYCFHALPLLIRVQILRSPVNLKVIANQLVIEFGVFGVTTITD